MLGYIFGSEDSLDLDVLFVVDQLKSTKENHSMVNQFCVEFGDQYNTDKIINGNLIVINNNQVVDSFKGTIDEVNNSLIDTNKFHNQLFEVPSLNRLDRDIWLKGLRVARVILSFYSRTDNRVQIKSALKGNIIEKLNVLTTLSITNEPIIGKKVTDKDVYKIIAFQFGQFFGLLDSKEFYTKASIAEYYEDLKPFLYRESLVDLSILDSWLTEFISIIFKNIVKMDGKYLPLKEYNYGNYDIIKSNLMVF